MQLPADRVVLRWMYLCPLFPSHTMSPSPRTITPDAMPQQGDLVEIEITDIGDGGEGVGRAGALVVFVPDTVTGDRIVARLVRVKRQFANGILHQLITPSPHRVMPSCIVADKCGGCQMQHVNYDYQLASKQNQVVQALERVGGFVAPPVAATLGASGNFDYRNKVTYPIGLGDRGQVKVGYYRKGSHRIVNLNQCPVQDRRLNSMLAEIKHDLQMQEWAVYEESESRDKSRPRLKQPVAQLRHLGLRIGRRTGEVLVTLVVTNPNLPSIELQARDWLREYPHLVGVVLNINDRETNTIFGDRHICIAGRDYINEEFGGLKFQLSVDTFFQIHTEQAETVLDLIASRLQLHGTETLVDAYCGIGTFTLPLARLVKRAIGIEVHPASVEQAKINAELNLIPNSEFHVGAVEKVLPSLDVAPDIILLDPPRQGCDRAVIEAFLNLAPDRIVYISCKPTTLARDLKILCAEGRYAIEFVQPADFFPQTAHVETVVFLKRQD
jgi:23S rRNA (uracil1939-C5)-methyltransferase